MTPPKPSWFIAPKWVGLALMLLLGALGLWWMGRSTPAPVTLVRTTRALPAYSLLTTADLTTTVALSTPGALTTLGAALGQITTEALPAQASVTADKLWQPRGALQNWWILTVPLSITVPPAVGETVIVLGVDGAQHEAHEISQQAIVLGVQGAKVVFALPPDAATLAATYLSDQRRLLVIRRLP